MERWRRLNVFVSLGGLLVFLLSLLLVKFNPLVLCLSAFALGIAWKGFKNIYKNVAPPNMEQVTNSHNTISKNKKKKR